METYGRPQKFSQRGGNVDSFFAYPFQFADDVNGCSQNALPFLNRKENSHESTRSVGILFEIVCRWRFYTNLPKECTSCHPIKLLLNWRIIQYRYYCQLPTNESELDITYPQLCLWCYH